MGAKKEVWAESKVLVLYLFMLHRSWWLTRKGTQLSCQYNWSTLNIFISMKVCTQKRAVDVPLNQLYFDWGPVHLPPAAQLVLKWQKRKPLKDPVLGLNGHVWEIQWGSRVQTKHCKNSVWEVQKKSVSVYEQKHSRVFNKTPIRPWRHLRVKPVKIHTQYLLLL